MTALGRFHRALAEELGLRPDDLRSPATLVVAEDDRSGSGRAVAYEVDAIVVVRSDPALRTALGDLASPDRAVSLEEIRGWADEHDWEVVDGGDQHLLPDGLGAPTVPLPDGATLTDLDTADEDVRSRIADLLAAVEPDDADEAEVDLDDLDPLAVAVLDGDGRIGAYASARPWELDERFDDIAVLVAPTHRRGGWGSAAVAALVGRSLDRERVPLYRCNWSNVGSKRLADRLGFRTHCRLLALAAER